MGSAASSDSDDDNGELNDPLEGLDEKLGRTQEEIAEALERRRKDQVIARNHRMAERVRQKYKLDRRDEDDEEEEDERKAKKKKHRDEAPKSSKHEPKSPKKKSEEDEHAVDAREQRHHEELERNRKIAERMRNKKIRVASAP